MSRHGARYDLMPRIDWMDRRLSTRGKLKPRKTTDVGEARRQRPRLMERLFGRLVHGANSGEPFMRKGEINPASENPYKFNTK